MVSQMDKMSLFVFAIRKVPAPIAEYNILDGKLLDLYGILTMPKGKLSLFSKRPTINFPFIYISYIYYI